MPWFSIPEPDVGVVIRLLFVTTEVSLGFSLTLPVHLPWTSAQLHWPKLGSLRATCWVGFCSWVETGWLSACLLSECCSYAFYSCVQVHRQGILHRPLPPHDPLRVHMAFFESLSVHPWCFDLLSVSPTFHRHCSLLADVHGGSWHPAPATTDSHLSNLFPSASISSPAILPQVPSLA